MSFVVTRRKRLVLLNLPLLAGCISLMRERPDLAAALHAQFRAHALQTFTHGDLYKPSDGVADGRIVDLAPLIVEERVSPSAVQRTMRSDPGGDSGQAIQAHPSVYYFTSTVTLNGQDFDQITFAWNYVPSSTDGRGARRSPSWRAVRMTLDRTGFPLVYELLGEDSVLRRLFVSKSLEHAAAAEYGEAPPGCLSALERGDPHDPEVLVVRILEDGPVPMGPIVYVTAAERSVSTLICRCMASQVENIVRSGYYPLRPANQADPSSPSDAHQAPHAPREPVPPLDCDDPSHLERILRWPHGL